MRIFSFLKKSQIHLLFAFLCFCVWCGCQAPLHPVPASGAGRWWKGNLHTHSQWSDGDSYPEMVVQWYAEQGYHFLALTDHNRIGQGEKWQDPNDKKSKCKGFQAYQQCFGADWIETRQQDGALQVRVKPLQEYRSLFERPGKFLLMAGEEITLKDKVHVNAINLVEQIPKQEPETIEERLHYALNSVADQSNTTGQPMIAQINHPNYGWTLTAELIAPLEGSPFLEVYNCDNIDNYTFGDERHASTERIWDIVLTRRLAELHLPVMYGTADDDAHNFLIWGKENSNPGRGWIMVRARSLTPESILQAMNKGDFYFSSGITLQNIRWDGKILRVKIQPEWGVDYVTQFIGTRRSYDPNSRPVLDEKGEEIHTTRIYSDQIGQILAEVKGAKASYTLKGDEIYVRAKVISTKNKANSIYDVEPEAAWTQPVLPPTPNP